MAVAYTYLAKSGSVAGTSLPGIRSFSVKKTAQKADLRGDGEIYARVSPIVSVEESIEVECNDTGVDIAIGASGSTVLVGAKLTGGVTQSGTLTLTAAKSTVQDVSRTIGDDGKPVIRISLSVESADGVASGLAWASA